MHIGMRPRWRRFLKCLDARLHAEGHAVSFDMQGAHIAWCAVHRRKYFVPGRGAQFQTIDLEQFVSNLNSLYCGFFWSRCSSLNRAGEIDESVRIVGCSIRTDNDKFGIDPIALEDKRGGAGG